MRFYACAPQLFDAVVIQLISNPDSSRRVDRPRSLQYRIA